MIRGRVFYWRLRDSARRLLHRDKPHVTRPILAELREFCHADTVPLRIDSTGRTDMYQTGIVAGRQEVLKKLQAILGQH